MTKKYPTFASSIICLVFMYRVKSGISLFTRMSLISAIKVWYFERTGGIAELILSLFGFTYHNSQLASTQGRAKNATGACEQIGAYLMCVLTHAVSEDLISSLRLVRFTDSIQESTFKLVASPY